MEDEFGRTIITLTDEDGEEFELELLGTVEDRGFTYYAVCDLDDEDGDDEELGYGILKVVIENGEELLEAVEDEDELNRIDALFMEQMDDGDEQPIDTE